MRGRTVETACGPFLFSVLMGPRLAAANTASVSPRMQQIHEGNDEGTQRAIASQPQRFRL
jgi:hypothetical protein